MRKVTFTLFVILSISMLSACELFGFDSNLKRRIDPEPTMDILNGQNLNEILTTENGYKKYKHELHIIREGSRNVKKDAFNSPPVSYFEDLIEINEEFPSVFESSIYNDTIKLVFSGVYNTENNTAYGNVEKMTTFESQDEMEEEFPLLYENDQYMNLSTDEEYHLPFLADKLKGIDKYIEPVYKYGLTDNKELIVGFNTDDELKEFGDFLNDELKIDYDQLDYAYITIGLTHKKENISYIDLMIKWTKKEGDSENADISYSLRNKLSFKHDGEDYKAEYENLKNAN